MGPLAAFGIAAVVVSLTLVVVSLISLALRGRADRLRPIRKGQAAGADAGNFPDNGDSGGYLWTQLGGHRSAHDHHSGPSDGGGSGHGGDSGSGDSGGGGDGGGGGD